MRSLQFLNACTNARRWLPATACAVLLAALGACGGGGSSTMSTPPPAATTSGCSASTCGAAVMTITDAAGDFLSYKVNLVSLQLQKSDGTMVETLPATTAVDFVQLITLSEVISARQIPPGNYVAAQVTVDFTNSSIMVDDGTGTGVAVKAVDSTGAALGQLALTVQLDNTNNLKIAAAKTSRIGFDFNLLASNMVNLTAKTVTVSPVLEASVVPVDNKQVRVRGEISAVDTANSDYTVAVDPFNDHDANDDNNNNNGGSGNDANDNDNDKALPLVVHTTATTTFEINGTPFSGAAGLAQLATLPANTLSVAFGSLSTTDQSFTATSVLAGTSVSGGNLDHIQGSVVARVGNTLTVHGGRMDDRDGHDDDHFMTGNTTITIAAATAVTAQGQASATPAHTIAEISVGSLIDAFGTASTDSSGKVTLDATAGRIRLDLTHVQGAMAASATGNITLNLTSIDRQPISLFSFTGTGSAAGVDTNPTKYVVTTGALSLTPFTVGDSVLGIGFVDPFGSTPPDFTAVTLADGVMGDNDDNDNGDNANRGKGAQMDIDWGDSGTTTPFKTLSATDLDLDVNNNSIGSKHRIQVDPQDVDIERLSSDVMIVGATSGMTLFAITGRHGRMTDNFQSFTDFEKALAADLNGTTTALRLTAQGQYDATTNTFTAQRITILLSN
jgi:hypothetical protein